MLKHVHDLKKDLRKKGWTQRESPQIHQTSFLRSEENDGQLGFKFEGRKSHLELNPELEGLLKKYSKTMSVRKISSVLESEHGMKVSKSSVPNLLKEIDFKKKEERNRRRRVS